MAYSDLKVRFGIDDDDFYGGSLFRRGNDRDFHWPQSLPAPLVTGHFLKVMAKALSNILSGISNCRQ
jgi:hypothetical protein